MTNGPAGMTTRERERSQNFGSNVVIGGSPIGFGQGQVDPGLAAAVQQQAGVTPQLAQQQVQKEFTGPFEPKGQQQTGVTTLTGGDDKDDGHYSSDDVSTCDVSDSDEFVNWGIQ